MKLSDLVEAVLAILVVGGVVIIAVYDTVAGKAFNIPQELVGFALLVLGSYFRGRSVNGTVESLTQALQQSQPAAPTPPPAAMA